MEPPNGFWLVVLVNWAASVDARGDTRFVMRPPVVNAPRLLGYPWARSVTVNKGRRRLARDDVPLAPER